MYEREAAAKELGDIGDSRPIEALIYALNKDDYRDVRAAAMKALGNIGGEEAEVALIQMLGYDPDYYYATDALVKIGKPAVKGLISVWGGDWNEVAQQVF